MRYEVTEIEGFNSLTSQVAGISCMVVDTLCNWMVVATFSTEGQRNAATAKGISGLPWERREYVRRMAKDLCDDLNANPELTRSWDGDAANV